VVDVPINNHHYHTDTIWLSETFTDEVIPKLEEIIKSGKVAPASEITIYTPEYITTTIEITPDSILLLVDELRDSLEIAKNYLLNFPNKPKLVALELTQNKLELTLLDISGSIKTNKYPLFLNKYDYIHTGSSLIYNKAGDPEPDLTGALYGVSGYSLLAKNLYIGGRYQVNYKKIILEANTEMTLEDNPALFIKVGVLLRLK